MLSIILFFVGNYIFLFQVDNNTFAPAKDSDFIGVEINFAPGTSMESAIEVASAVEQITEQEIGQYIVKGLYGPEFSSDNRQAVVRYDLVPFTDRDVTSPAMGGRGS